MLFVSNCADSEVTIVKKILIVFLILFCGCSKSLETESGYSRTYLFFKNFDVNKYYVSFYDRNVSSGDKTKINMAKLEDNYFYEIDGFENRIIIQKDGKRYTINKNLMNYFEEEGNFEDFSHGFIPNDIEFLKKNKYETGYQKVFNQKYIYEKYKLDEGESTYYFDGYDLVYVSYKSIFGSNLLKFISMKNDVDSSIFEISKKYSEMSY